MTNPSRRPEKEEQALRRAVRHPKRLEMLGYLTGEGTGIDEVELAEALGLNLSLVKYHLKILQSAGLVVSVDREPGASEHYVAA